MTIYACPFSYGPFSYVMIPIAERHSGDISRKQYELQHQVQLWSDTKAKRRAGWKSDQVPKMRPNAENKTQDTTC